MNTELPKCLQGPDFSGKSFIIKAVDRLLDLSYSRENGQLLFVTPYGLIKADVTENYPTLEDAEAEIKTKESIGLNTNLAVDVRIKMLLELEKKENITLSLDPFVSLEDVTIYRDNSPAIHLNDTILFLDQVISVSLVPRDWNK